MAEFACLKDGVFVRTIYQDTRPPHIPHKSIEWFPVVREHGAPGEGVEGDAYIIRTVDPATLPPPVPQVVSASAARRALLAAGLLDTVEAAVAAADRETQIMWEYETQLHRDHPKIVALGGALGLDLAELFSAVGQL